MTPAVDIGHRGVISGGRAAGRPDRPVFGKPVLTVPGFLNGVLDRVSVVVLIRQAPEGIRPTVFQAEGQPPARILAVGQQADCDLGLLIQARIVAQVVIPFLVNG